MKSSYPALLIRELSIFNHASPLQTSNRRQQLLFVRGDQFRDAFFYMLFAHTCRLHSANQLPKMPAMTRKALLEHRRHVKVRKRIGVYKLLKRSHQVLVTLSKHA
jgi:hypothetical protein